MAGQTHTCTPINFLGIHLPLQQTCRVYTYIKAGPEAQHNALCDFICGTTLNVPESLYVHPNKRNMICNKLLSDFIIKKINPWNRGQRVTDFICLRI